MSALKGTHSAVIEDAHDLPDGHVQAVDLCIVGAGAAGIAMALEFIGSGINVLLLESGGLHAEAATQALYAGEVADERLHSPLDRYRERRFGGSTTIWGGRCMPFDDIDFEARDYVPHSGWPITREALMPFYPRANRLCEAGDFAYTAAETFGTGTRPMISGFHSAHFSSHTLERFSCPTIFSSRYAHRLRAASNVRVLLHANVTCLHRNADGSAIEHAAVRSLKGNGFTVRATRFVLATGGLEAPRLLLASRDVNGVGLGNQHDQVGRYYMCHLAGTIGTLQFDSCAGAVYHGYELSDEGVYCRRRLALSAETQRRLRLGNFIARLHHPRITDPAHRTGLLSLLVLAKTFIPYEYGKRLHGEQRSSLRQWLQHLRNVVTDPFGTLGFLWHWLRDRTLADRKFPSIIIRSRANRYSLDFHAEQQPNPDSRVTLSGSCDALGMPRLRVDWRYTAGDVETVRTALALLKQDIERCDLGRFDYDPRSVEGEMTRYGAYGGHHIGTARMGSDPRSSVVDADCRVHGIDNLYIASSAVFPTSGQANPTLTIVALALRLAEHVKQRHVRCREADRRELAAPMFDAAQAA
jgi:choline dehydrogenase-like flavoprotein